MTATQHRRDRLPSPTTLRNELRDHERLADKVRILSRIALEGYEELYEASLQPSSAAGDRVPPGKNRFQSSDPTGEVAVSGMHKHMRNVANNVAHKLRKVAPILLECEQLIGSAFAATDPEFQEQLHLLREREESLAGTTTSPSTSTTRRRRAGVTIDDIVYARRVLDVVNAARGVASASPELASAFVELDAIALELVDEESA